MKKIYGKYSFIFIFIILLSLLLISCPFKVIPEPPESSIETIIASSDQTNNDRFGTSVSLCGNYAVIGAIHVNSGGKKHGGQAYVFKRD